MKSAKNLTVLPVLLDEQGLPGFTQTKWSVQRNRWVRVTVPVTDDEQERQKHEPVRLSHEPRYWLYRNRFVRQEDVASEPDDYVDLIEAIAADEPAEGDPWSEQRNKWRWHRLCAARILLREPSHTDFHNQVWGVRRGRLLVRHSQLAEDYPDELVLQVKHKVLSEEQSFDKLRREVEAFENFERINRTPRESIPKHIQMYVWQRDNARCVECGSEESLEFDHIIPLARGGASTERNIQLLCERCNRSKGSRIGGASLGQQAPSRAAATTPRVLVVDDNAGIRDLLAKTFALAEYEVDTAPDRPTAIKQLTVCPYDLIVVDLTMAGMEGQNVIREAQRLKAVPAIVAVIESNSAEALKLGHVHYLTKPFKVPQVFAVAAKALGRDSL